MLWILVLAFAFSVAGLAIILYVLKQRTSNSLTLSDGVNLLAVGIALGSVYIAINTYQQSIADSEEQQKSLNVSRTQLAAVVAAMAKQQEILDSSLETLKAQQQVLDKGIQLSKTQQEILSKTLETAKAHLNLQEEREKREKELRSRRPIAEITILVEGGGSLKLDDLEKLPEINFPLLQGKKWKSVAFYVRNKGKVEIIRPVVKLVSSHDGVSIDGDGVGQIRAEGRLRDPRIYKEFQVGGHDVSDIPPEEVMAGIPWRVMVDITVPDSVNAFDLTVLIHGTNLKVKAHTLHFKVTRPPS